MGLTIADFKAMANGTHNLGSLLFDETRTKLVKVNNHATMTWLNNKTASLAALNDVKRAFVGALRLGGLSENLLRDVCREVGFDDNGKVKFDDHSAENAFKPLERAKVKEILDRYVGKYSPGIDRFDEMTRGRFNAGEFTLDGKGRLAVVNNHATMTGKNNVSISPETILQTKQLFIKALAEAGLRVSQLNIVRTNLGLPLDGEPDPDPVKLANLKPLTRADVRKHITLFKANFRSDEDNLLEADYVKENRLKYLYVLDSDAEEVMAKTNEATAQARVKELRTCAKEMFETCLGNKGADTDPALTAATVYLMLRNEGTTSPDEIKKLAQKLVDRLYPNDDGFRTLTQAESWAKSKIDHMIKVLKDGEPVAFEEVDDFCWNRLESLKDEEVREVEEAPEAEDVSIVEEAAADEDVREVEDGNEAGDVPDGEDSISDGDRSFGFGFDDSEDRFPDDDGQNTGAVFAFPDDNPNIGVDDSRNDGQDIENVPQSDFPEGNPSVHGQSDFPEGNPDVEGWPGPGSGFPGGNHDNDAVKKYWGIE